MNTYDDNFEIPAPDENVVCFYHEYEENGCFSNWYRAEFEYAGKRFTSVEQYMMYHKVIMFRQYDLATKILSSDDPSVIKKLGRTHFPEFDAALWEKTCYAIVRRGVRAKFEQNPDILQLLLATGEKILAECSLKDTKWGIGLAIDDPDCYHPSQWNGKNYLGRILMEVRDDLRRASALGKLGYEDAKDIDFPLWHFYAGTLRRNPKFYDTLNAYADTLRGNYERVCFFFNGPLSEWEEAMRTNMGGGLPAVGFWELKQDLYDITKV